MVFRFEAPLYRLSILHLHCNFQQYLSQLAAFKCVIEES